MTEAKMKKQDVITQEKRGQKILKVTFYKVLPKC